MFVMLDVYNAFFSIWFKLNQRINRLPTTFVHQKFYVDHHVQQFMPQPGIFFYGNAPHNVRERLPVRIELSYGGNHIHI